ncbi:MAG: phospholipase/carboxylesterase [Actinomycetota bacterium]|jgi:phospholipase/carboxylesterase|nr:phospholipase/carboxylesterase [Actinomycetota bacterium]
MSDDDLSVSWSRPPLPGDDLLILLHGFEGTEHDLDDRFPDLPSSVVTASLRAPVRQNTGHAWFLHDYGVRDAVDNVFAWLDTQSGFATVGVLGLSQGGAMALELIRQAPERFTYAVQLSGIILGLDAAPRLAKLRPPVFSGHGDLDEIVPKADVIATNEWLVTHTRLTVRDYVGMGHWISAAEATDVCAFIRAVLGGHDPGT